MIDPELLKEARAVSAQTGTEVRLVIPSVLAPGEAFTLRISVIGRDGLPVEDFPHALRFEGSVGVNGLPASYRLDAGCATGEITGLTATEDPVALVRAALVDTEVYRQGEAMVSSNPAWVTADPPWRLYWGDLHVHTRPGNCHPWRCLDPAWCYAYAREISLLDFAAAADHLRGIATADCGWERWQELAKATNDPGRFVSFLAFESSHAQGFGGDNNAYFLDDDAPHFWLDREDMKGTAPKVTLEELWAQLDAAGHDYFTVPHHTGRATKYRSWEEDRYDPRREPLFEIYSSWGSSETRHSRFPISGGNNDAPSYFDDALRAGTRFGVIASSDDHATLPGAVNQFRVPPYGAPDVQGFSHKGLVAVRAPSLERGALFGALSRRDCYATTHARTLVDVTLHGVAMGTELTADASLRARRELTVRVTPDHAARLTVTLLRNGSELVREVVQGPDVGTAVNELRLVDESPLDLAVIRGAKFHPAPFVAYHLRVEDNGGGAQWTSPIWVDLE